MDFSARYYIVKQIDGDYAHLELKEESQGNTVLVARALLPDTIYEGCELKYEMLQYEQLN